jgi:hypothetical protein
VDFELDVETLEHKARVRTRERKALDPLCVAMEEEGRLPSELVLIEAYPTERHFRDCRSFHLEKGTEEIHKLLIASDVLAR